MNIGNQTPTEHIYETREEICCGRNPLILNREKPASSTKTDQSVKKLLVKNLIKYHEKSNQTNQIERKWALMFALRIILEKSKNGEFKH